MREPPTVAAFLKVNAREIATDVPLFAVEPDKFVGMDLMELNVLVARNDFTGVPKNLCSEII